MWGDHVDSGQNKENWKGQGQSKDCEIDIPK